jgi:Transposase DDE domain
MIDMPKLESQGNRPLQITFEDHLKALVYFHLEEHHSAQHLLQVLEQDDFARNQIAPEDGIKKSSFSEATNSRGLEQFFYVFENLQAQATQLFPKKHPELGTLIGIDGSLIDVTLSMYWADYRKNSKKAKVHVGFDLNRAIPRKVFLTDGNGAERPFVSKILSDDQTGVTDRGYHCHKQFDQWQDEDKNFICRIKASTQKSIIEKKELTTDSIVFFDAIVLLGTAGVNQTKKPLRLVGY